MTIGPGKIGRVPTGIALELPSGVAGFVFGRSGLGVKKGVVPANGVGVIDWDYRGEVQVGLINHGEEPFVVENGDRIAQLVLLPGSDPGTSGGRTALRHRSGVGGLWLHRRETTITWMVWTQ